jgi:aminoglycoside 2''-phosphotransferase
MQREAARAALLRSSPDLGSRSVRVLPGGWDFLALEVDRRWVFRFPVRPSSEEQIRREFALLPLLARHVGVPVPDYLFRHEPDRSFRHRFGGYPKLGGVRVDRAGLSPRALARTGRELGEALTGLHAISRARAVAAGLPYRTSSEVRRAFLGWGTRVRSEVRPFLDPSSRERLDTLFDGLTRPGILSFRPAVIHNDLLPAHVLVAARTGAITGLIDWGDIEFGDPAFDFGVMGQLPHLGPAMYRGYDGRIDPHFRERADAYGRLAPAHGVLYAEENGDRRLLTRSVHRLVRALERPGPAPRATVPRPQKTGGTGP